MIRFKNVSKRYGKTVALDHVNLTIPAHSIFVIVGPSGSGKTTMLKMINRLIEPTGGKVIINHKSIGDYPLRQLRLKMSYVLQSIALFPNLTIEQNVGVQLRAEKKPKKDRIKIAQKLLAKVGMDPDKYGSRYPDELSGGEQQRIGIIRALAVNPRIILMDEPFSALDPIIRRKLQNLVLKLHHELNNTIVFITHDMHEALKMGQQIAVLYHGRIQQIGSGQEILQHPRNQIVRKLFKPNDQQHVYDLIQQGLATPVNESTDEALISPNASLATLASRLQKSPVKVKYQHRFWRITVKDLLRFISKGLGSHA
ncbi:ABC transporter ATP-binding protein [uncultured bacterium]|uniref:ABC-type quaternary amine transporter n=2 Tax=Acetilactobacillus jinshanensis TaxID=1720083 RepID=A0A4P6ZMQ3_9LACO|nr:ABC transporter ATP-binding protein [Acetilactobacillus jinshanensis]URL61917.1 ABC transporter ATP-binding protein [uncultured bacterium]